jgi:DNA-binding PadR family transcriptional regulator
MSLEMTLLGLLHAKPATGYALKKAMDASTEFLSPSPLSQIYPTLKRMTDRGWLRFEIEVRVGRPDLKTYTLTGDGLAAFCAWIEAPPPLNPHTFSDFLLRFFFFHLLDPSAAERHTRAELTFRSAQLEKARLRVIYPPAGLQPAGGFDPGRALSIWRMAQRHGETTLEAYTNWLAWAAECLSTAPAGADMPRIGDLDEIAKNR